MRTLARPRGAAEGLNVRTRGLPHIAIDHTPPGSPTRGNIYVVFQATPLPPATARSQVFFTRSTDGGKTWDMPRSISNGPAVTLNGDATQNDNWMPSIAVSPVTGHIRVIFYSRREDPQNIDIRVYDAGSSDGGLTWFNRPRSTTAFKPSTGYDTLVSLASTMAVWRCLNVGKHIWAITSAWSLQGQTFMRHGPTPEINVRLRAAPHVPARKRGAAIRMCSSPLTPIRPIRVAE